jgi:3-isopropylmalate dehydrogenase
MAHVTVIPGDGIGVDVTAEAVKVLRAAAAAFAFPLELEQLDYNADRFLRTGEAFPASELERIRTGSDAVFLGAVGDPRIPDMTHAREILFGLRFGLDLYINLRPVKCLHASLMPLRDRRPEDVDLVFFRENTEGLYVNMGGIFKKGTPHEVAINEDVNTRHGVERILRAAFEYARTHGRRKVTMADKSNALRFAHDLWQRAFAEVGSEYQDLEQEHLYVDALAMQLIRKPQNYDVVVTCNMFGDILTDLGAALQGGLGMAASGNIHPGRVSMFEPVHGSAPKYAGKDVANPLAAILTAAMLLDHVGQARAGAAIEAAVSHALAEHKVPKDLGGELGTCAMGDYIADAVTRSA